ncbi:MAG: NADH-quinone oxidoreductase subunit A [Chloroflexi bacterium]|nr:NADH-quinone oxidoreductase subunit A [Chloroflexota bacterium]
MLADYGSVALFLVVAVLFTVSTLAMPPMLRRMGIISKNRPNPIKNATYECGLQPTGKAWVQFNFRYYFYALVFISLDVVVVFIYPWAVQVRQLGVSALIAIVVLLFIVIVGVLYAWKKNVLEWK